MGAESRRREITARVLRNRAGQGEPLDAEEREQTMETRIATVWYLTLQCMAWNRDEGKGDADQPRLARSVCRLERRRG
jgi:hypothetical protein